MAAYDVEQQWEPVASAPVNRWIRTKHDGERNEHVCALHRVYFLETGEMVTSPTENYEDEWIERATGVTALTRRELVTPTYWTALHE